MKDPRMKPVSQDQPGFKKLKHAASRKSEHRSQVKKHGKRKGYKS